MTPQEELDLLRKKKRLQDLEAIASGRGSSAGEEVVPEFISAEEDEQPGRYGQRPSLFRKNPDARSKEFSSSELLKGGAASKGQEFRYYTDLLAQKYGSEEGAKRIQQTPEGRVLVKDQSNKWRLVGPGLGPEDLVGAIPETLEAVGGVGGGLLGLLGGTPTGPGAVATGIAGEAAGSAAGSFGGELLTGAIGRKINPEYSESPLDSMSRAQKEAMDSAMWSLGTSAGFEAFKTARGFLRGFGPAISPKDAMDLLKNHDEYFSAIKQVNSANDVANLQLGVVPRLPHENAKLALSVNSSEEKDRLARTYDSLEAYLNPQSQAVPGVTSAVGEPTAAGALRTAGEGPQMAVELTRQDLIDNPEKLLTMTRGKLQKASEQLANIPRTAETAPKVAEIVQGMMQTAKADRDRIYGAYEDMIGQAPGTFTSKHQVPISDKLISLKKELAELEKSGADVNSKALLKGIKKNGTVDLAALDYRIKLLNDRLYEHSRGLTIPFSKRTGDTVLAALREMRDDYVEKIPSVSTLLTSAQEAHQLYTQTYRQGFIEKLVQEDGKGGFVLTDPGMVAGILGSGDGQAIRQLAGIAKGHPGLGTELQRLALAHYKSVVMPNGSEIIDKAAHDAYMKDGGWYDKIAPFFDDKTKNLIRVQGGLAKAVLDNEQRLQAVQNEWAKLHKGKIKNLNVKNPETFVKEIFSSSGTSLNPASIGFLFKKMEQYVPERIPAFQAGVREALVNKIRMTSGKMSSPRLDTIIARHGANLKAVLGADYVKDLGTAATILRHEGRMASDVSDKLRMGGVEEGAGLARQMIYGPLSSTGYRMNIFAGLRGTTRANEVYEAMTDPEALKKWISFYNRRVRQRVSAGAVSLIAEDQVNDD